MDLKHLQKKLEDRSQGLKAQFRDYACVAVILRGASMDQLEVGFIRRSIVETDRWSGQIAFPGGRAEAIDEDDLATAIRETREEVGLSLSKAQLLGRLDDIQARKGGQLLDFYIRPFVFFMDHEETPVLNPDEVADFFWVTLADLRDQKRQIEYELSREQVSMKLPAIQMASDPPLWGLTYLMTQDLLRRI